MDEFMDQLTHWVTRLLEIGGIAVILIGAAVASVTWLLCYFRSTRVEERYSEFRSSLGRSILLGLEFLVAADIVNTAAVDPTLDSLAILAGIVLIRTFLSFALEAELEGRWPWQRHRAAEVSES